jgi:hypothetical protein
MQHKKTQQNITRETSTSTDTSISTAHDNQPTHATTPRRQKQVHGEQHPGKRKPSNQRPNATQPQP